MKGGATARRNKNCSRCLYAKECPVGRNNETANRFKNTTTHTRLLFDVIDSAMLSIYHYLVGDSFSGIVTSL